MASFIINGGGNGVVVSQLHRSPGVDFVLEQETTTDRRLPSCRIIPERGSWIEVNVTKKDSLTVRIDQSGKFPASMLLRAMDPKYSSDADIIRAFYESSTEKVVDGRSAAKLEGKIAVDDVYYPAGTDRAGEIIVEGGHKISKDASEVICTAGISKVEVLVPPKSPLLFNCIAEDQTSSHEEALLRIYQRLRPGNPPQLEKARTLFHGEVLRHQPLSARSGRPVSVLTGKLEIPDSVKEMTLRVEDLIASVQYVMDLFVGDPSVEKSTISITWEIAGSAPLMNSPAMNYARGFLKLRRTVQERMSLKAQEDMTPRTLINPKSISAAIEYFFGRGELSQVVDQTNPLSQLTHERRLSALGPGGLNRKRAGFEVRDVHISHYGRICPD